jgi:mono/diheme cytochrome c family protein
MKLWKAFSLAVPLVVVIAAGYGIALIRGGFSTRESPSAVERFVATTARQMAVPSKYRELRSPVAASPENIQAGLEHFSDHCATCHANDGSGDTLFGKGLYPKPPDMRTAETQNKGDGELYYTIENGIRLSGMPAFGEERTAGGDAETWKLVLFIRHLPKLTTDELQHMEQLNPKTEEDRQEEKEEQEFLNGKEPPKAVPGTTPVEPHHH